MSYQFTDEALTQSLPGFSNAFAQVNGVLLHYVTGGSGEPLVLLPGWPVVIRGWRLRNKKV